MTTLAVSISRAVDTQLCEGGGTVAVLEMNLNAVESSVSILKTLAVLFRLLQISILLFLDHLIKIAFL